jgi:hypothetical protein
VLDVEVNHPRGFDFLTHFTPPTSPSQSIAINENDDITEAHYSLFFVDNDLEGVYKKWFDHNLSPISDVIPVRTNQADPRQIRAYPRYERRHCSMSSLRNEKDDKCHRLPFLSFERLLLLWFLL